jgi:hypothetical protein
MLSYYETSSIDFVSKQAQTDKGFQRIPISQRFYYIMNHWVRLASPFFRQKQMFPDSLDIQAIDAPANLKPFEETVHAFPAGFRQMIGDPARKSPLKSANIQPHVFWCVRKNADAVSSQTFPKGCEYIKMTSMMPPCWDGKNLWLKNSAHTAVSQLLHFFFS